MQKLCLELNNGKKINIDVYEEYAPLTVANFIHLVEIGFYNETNLLFHRIIKGFMIQGGAYFIQDNKLNEKQTGYTIPGEFTENNFKNPILHKAGTISMARTNDPNSASNQFFICDQDCAFLDNKYAAFGTVSDEESLAVVREIASMPTGVVAGMSDFPNCAIDDVAIKAIYKRLN